MKNDFASGWNENRRLINSFAEYTYEICLFDVKKSKHIMLDCFAHCMCTQNSYMKISYEIWNKFTLNAPCPTSHRISSFRLDIFSSARIVEIFIFCLENHADAFGFVHPVLQYQIWRCWIFFGRKLIAWIGNQYIA